MATRKPTSERLAAFSDGVIAIIITIMVWELKAPHNASVDALLELWPTLLSYALSYLFVGVFWINHHHLLHYTERADPRVMCANLFANLFVLFFVSLMHFSDDYHRVHDLAEGDRRTVLEPMLSYRKWVDPPANEIGLPWSHMP
jgi:uncharacterized membrane protein